MERIRIRLEDGTFASVPRVAKIVEEGEASEYVWFKSEKRHIYIFPACRAMGSASNDDFNREEAEAMEPCSVEEYNEIVMKIVEQIYICHEDY